MNKRLLKVLLIAILVILMDQLTKFLALNKNLILIPKVLLIKYSENPGIIFGLFSDNKFIIILIPILLIIYLSYLVYKKEINLVGGTLIVSGLLGNLIDRFVRGFAVDFIFVPIIPEYNISLFNLADASLVIGVVIGVYYLFKKEKKR